MVKQAARLCALLNAMREKLNPARGVVNRIHIKYSAIAVGDVGAPDEVGSRRVMVQKLLERGIALS